MSATGKKDFAGGIGSKLEKVDHWVATLTAIPVFGFILKKVFDKITEKGAEKLGKKVERALGIDVDEFGKGFGDEILFREAVRQLLEDDQQKIEDFRLWLRKKDEKEKTKNAEAFVLGIAKAVKAFEKPIKKVHSVGGGKSGRPLDKTETSGVEYDYSWSKNFFARLLKRKSNKKKEEFVFLEANFRSLIPPNKPPLLTLEKVNTVVGKIDPELSKIAVHVTEIKQKISGRPYEGFRKELKQLSPWRKKS